MNTDTMSDQKEFKPLKDLGAIPVTDSSEIRFYVDAYKGFSYGSIRTFVKRDNYAGPTKSGLTLNPAVLDAVIEALAKLPDEPAHTEDAELLRIAKKTGIELVVRITIYRDSTGIDMREWVDDGVYKGWSKKGVRLNYAELPKIREFLGGMKLFLAERAKEKN